MTSAPARPAPQLDVRLALTAWAAMTAALALTAAAASAGPLTPLADRWFPHAPDPQGVTVLGLLVHNVAIALAPLALVAVRWHTSPRWRRAGDVVIGLLLARQAIVLGLAIGAWPQVLPHLPHLPIELAALIAGAMSWHAASRGRGTRAAAVWVAVAVALLSCAAVIEVAAAPGTSR